MLKGIFRKLKNARPKCAITGRHANIEAQQQAKKPAAKTVALEISSGSFNSSALVDVAPDEDLRGFIGIEMGLREQRLIPWKSRAVEPSAMSSIAPACGTYGQRYLAFLKFSKGFSRCTATTSIGRADLLVSYKR